MPMELNENKQHDEQKKKEIHTQCLFVDDSEIPKRFNQLTKCIDIDDTYNRFEYKHK